MLMQTVEPWSTLVEGGKEQYRPPGKLTLELVLANQKQNKLLCLWTMQLTKWGCKVPYLLLLKCSMVELVSNIFTVRHKYYPSVGKISLAQLLHMGRYRCCSVTRFGRISPLWQNSASFGETFKSFN